MQLPIEEYFKYHPPTTPERIALHDRVNKESLEICKAFIESNDYDEWLAFRDAAILLAEAVCCDEICLGWAKAAITNCVLKCWDLAIEYQSTSILMYIQQFRMFLNQGIVVSELQRLKIPIRQINKRLLDLVLLNGIIEIQEQLKISETFILLSDRLDLINRSQPDEEIGIAICVLTRRGYNLDDAIKNIVLLAKTTKKQSLTQSLLGMAQAQKATQLEGDVLALAKAFTKVFIESKDWEQI